MLRALFPFLDDAQGLLDSLVRRTRAAARNEIRDLVAYAHEQFVRLWVPVFYRTVFWSAGAVMVAWGAGAFLESALGVRGSGAFMGGVLLLALGAYVSRDRSEKAGSHAEA